MNNLNLTIHWTCTSVSGAAVFFFTFSKSVMFLSCNGLQEFFKLQNYQHLISINQNKRLQQWKTSKRVLTSSYRIIRSKWSGGAQQAPPPTVFQHIRATVLPWTWLKYAAQTVRMNECGKKVSHLMLGGERYRGEELYLFWTKILFSTILLH